MRFRNHIPPNAATSITFIPAAFVAAFMVAAFAVAVCAPVAADGAEAVVPAATKAVREILAAKCVRCHGRDEPQGGVNLLRLDVAELPTARAELLQRAVDAIDANEMPPADEPQLTPEQRDLLLGQFAQLLRDAVAAMPRPSAPLHRLTRFQYNNAVRDLFQLNRDLFELSEKLVVRREPYLTSSTGKMPDVVDVAARAMQPPPVLDGVKPFPKDLRAEHGFDNQANKLTLSPLLLDTFLRLGVSIVESPDFNAQNVGIWNEFFLEPTDAADRAPDRGAEIDRRLKPFLRRAFREPVDEETVRRYGDYVRSKIATGASFFDAMKKVASAVLCSPKFLYRAASADGSDSQFVLASRLSFFLWGSLPDAELLELAERGELSQPNVLRRSVERMLRDPKIERLLDSFPTQWMQLENALAVTPDPKRSRYFHVDPNFPASLSMVIEPLLLFDAAFVENRPASELLAPAFSYRNDFLCDWYETDLTPPPVNERDVLEHNRQLDDQRRRLQTVIAESRQVVDAIVMPAREKLLAERKRATNEPRAVDLKPLAVWEFNGDLQDSLQGLHLTAHGDVKFADGQVVLERAYLQSSPLKIDLRAKSLEAWCVLPDVKQRGGGVMTIQGPGDFFDSIVLGERQPGHWISGSNGFARTDDFPQSTPETVAGEKLHLTMVYDEDGTTRLYRNGVPYGQPFRKGSATFPKNETTVLFGLRHVPAGGNKYLAVRLDKARLYDRALTAEEVRSAASGYSLDISEQELVDSLQDIERADLKKARELVAQAEAKLAKVSAPQDVNALRQETQRNFENQLRAKLRSSQFRRTPLTDPRYGGVLTNAAVLSMTSGPQRTQPIARGSWIVEVLFNDPPPPPPNNVPPLKETDNAHLTIREQFAAHRENPSCAGCHAKIDPLGFALENFDITGRWREKYDNGRPIDASGTLFRKHDFQGAVDFKAALARENHRFARALVAHLLRYAQARELTPADSFVVDEILQRSAADGYRVQTLIREVAIHLGQS